MSKRVDESGCSRCGQDLEGPPSSHCKIDGNTVHAHCFSPAWKEKIQEGSS